MTGSLRALYTDIWCRRGRGLLSHGPLFARAVAGRFHPQIPSRKVTSFSTGALVQSLRSRQARSVRSRYLDYARVGEWFCRRVNQSLLQVQLISGVDAFFGFNTACLETIQLLRDRKVLTIVDQIDPGAVEEQMVQEEVRRWPGWQDVPGKIPEEYFRRIEAEWELADLVVVNSKWSAAALQQRGVDPAKMIVAPVGYEPVGSTSAIGAHARSNVLRVLWLGTVNLRKGIPYLIEAAKLLKDEAIEFIVAGPLAISAEAVASAPPKVSFRGRVSRTETADLYRQADVFILPTVSDGFAITQLEAMGFGLPVITTPNCGEVVTPGNDGLIVPARDAEALAAAILQLHRDRALLAAMSLAAPAKAGQFGLLEQTKLMESAIRNRMEGVKIQTGGN